MILIINLSCYYKLGVCSQKLKELKLSEIFEQLLGRENVPAEMQLNSLKLFTCFLQKGN